MKYKLIAILICMLLISSSILTFSGAKVVDTTSKPLSRGNTLYVGGSGPNNYTSIQDAIDDASHWDTVFVYDDSSPYYENLIVNKSINLIGENKNTTIIDGMRKSNVIHVDINDVYIRGFTIKNSTRSGTTPAGIRSIRTVDVCIEQNILTKNANGIFMQRCDNWTVSNNNMTLNSNPGVHMVVGNNLTCLGNEFTDNDYFAIFLIAASNSTISFNIIKENYGGIKTGSDCDYTLFSNNIIIDNDDAFYGLNLLMSRNVTIRNNLFKNKVMYEIELSTSCYNNSIYHNNIDGVCASNEGNTWDNGYPSSGNYWDDYEGEDNYSGPKQNIRGSDGIGDTPKKVDSDDWDRYPLMYPMGENPPMANYTYKLDNYTIRLDGSISLDRDGTVESYEWDFGDNNSGSGMKATHTFSKSGKYKVELNVTDDDGNQGNWSLSINVPNQPPYAPKDPNPSDGATNVDVNADLSWMCNGDPEGGPVTFNVYFESGDTTPDVLVSENQTFRLFDPGKMDYTTDYYWQIVTWDELGASTPGPVWDFTTEANVPPQAPEFPDPSDGATDVDINADLSWNCSDPDEDNLTYNVYFEADDSTPDVLVSENQTLTSFDPGKMNHTTHYYWRIVAFDHLGASTSGPVWDFTTRANAPPNSPKNPEPPDGATEVDVNATLSWKCTDPDDDELTYDVYFEADDSTPDVLVSNNQSETWYDPGTMNYSTHYYWQIVAWDTYGHSTSGAVWDFITGSLPNNPPYIPNNPDPGNGSTDVDIDTDLSWSGGDPDSGDTVVYDVFLEADDSSPDVQVADDITETTFDPGILEYETKYYWRVIAKDNHGASTPGIVWRFTTESASEPDLSCEGSLNWVDVEPGSTVKGSFTVENKGEPLSLLDWKVTDWPKDWGSWTFTPSNGDDLIPGEPCTVNISVIAPDKKNSKFTGEVTITNTENSSDFCTIDVSLVTPKSKLFNFNFNLLEWLLDRFPILQKILDALKVSIRSSCPG